MNYIRHLTCISLSIIMSVACAATSIEKDRLHDPTKPVIGINNLNQSELEQSTFNLESIIISPMRKLAMINGQIVGTGSSIQGARVLAIAKNHVVLLHEGKKETIYLFGKKLWKAY